MIGIIGGSGFIGSRLAHLLSVSQKEFKIIDKRESPIFNEKCSIVDIRDYELLKEALTGCDTVINLAAEHRDDVTPKSLYDEVNVQGSENVCKACDELGINRIIFTSSVAVYGFAPKGTDERGDINYFNDYGRTKWEGEIKYRNWLEGCETEKSLTIIRPTAVFGERNRGNIYNLFRQIASGLFPMIGSGRNIKSIAYVENIAAFLEYSLTNPVGESLFNYIDKPDFDMNKLVVTIKGALGKKGSTGFHWPYFLGYAGGVFFDLIAFISRKKFPISRIRIKKFCSDTMFEASRIKKTDFIPPVSLEEGIENTIRFEFLNKDAGKDQILFYSE